MKASIFYTFFSSTLISCADGPPATLRTASACRSEPECVVAYHHARARADRCHAGTRSGIQIIDAASRLGGCDQEDATAQAAGQRLAWFQAQRRMAADAFARQQQWEAQERARLQHEKAEAERRAEVQQRVESHWRSLDVRACSVGGDSSACDALSEFIAAYPDGPHQAEATEALRVGRDKVAELRAKEQEALEIKAANQRREDAARAQEATRALAARAKEGAEARARDAEVRSRAAAKASCRTACQNKCAPVLDQAGFQSCLQSCNSGCN